MAGTIENRGNGAWRIGTQVKDDFGVWHWVRETVHVDPSMSVARQRKEATAALAALLVAVNENGLTPSNTNTTLRDFIEIWQRDHAAHLEPTTRKTYDSFINARILPMLGDYPLKKLTPMVCTEWISAVRSSPRISTRKDDADLKRKRTPSEQAKLASSTPKPLSPRTVQHYFDMLYDILDAAVRWEYITANPLDRCTRPKARKARVTCLSEAQAIDLINRCRTQEENPCYVTAMLLAICCGMRLGEIAALRLSDIDFEAGTISIHASLKSPGNIIGTTKSEESDRTIAMPDIVRSELEKERDFQASAPGTYGDVWEGNGTIVHAWNGKCLSHDTVSKWFRRFADQNGYPDLRFHDLRHTHASILLANGIDVVAVAARLGHADSATTLRTYAHALKRRDTDAASVLDAVLSRKND